MPNPSGTNQFQSEPAYGAKKVLDQLSRSAVMAGNQGATSAIETPRRAKRKAARGQRENGPVPAGMEPMAPVPAAAQQETPELPYDVRILAVWEEIAANPDASPLAKEYLDDARRLAGAAAA